MRSGWRLGTGGCPPGVFGGGAEPPGCRPMADESDGQSDAAAMGCGLGRGNGGEAVGTRAAVAGRATGTGPQNAAVHGPQPLGDGDGTFIGDGPPDTSSRGPSPSTARSRSPTESVRSVAGTVPVVGDASGTAIKGHLSCGFSGDRSRGRGPQGARRGPSRLVRTTWLGTDGRRTTQLRRVARPGSVTPAGVRPSGQRRGRRATGGEWHVRHCPWRHRQGSPAADGTGHPRVRGTTRTGLRAHRERPWRRRPRARRGWDDSGPARH